MEFFFIYIVFLFYFIPKKKKKIALVRGWMIGNINHFFHPPYIYDMMMMIRSSLSIVISWVSQHNIWPFFCLKFYEFTNEVATNYLSIFLGLKKKFWWSKQTRKKMKINKSSCMFMMNSCFFLFCLIRIMFSITHSMDSFSNSTTMKMVGIFFIHSFLVFIVNHLVHFFSFCFCFVLVLFNIMWAKKTTNHEWPLILFVDDDDDDALKWLWLTYEWQ